VTEGPGQIYEAAARLRQAVLRREQQAAGQLIRAYGAIWQQLRGQTARLLAQYAAAQAAAQAQGQPFGPAASWLFQYNRLQALEAQTAAALQEFAALAETTIAAEQRAAVELAAAHAEELVRDQGAGGGGQEVGVRWDRLPREAVDDLVGFLQDGSPLRALLDGLAPQGSLAVRDALLGGLAAGLNPRTVARQVRDGLGVGLARALTISRTEMLRAYREASLRNYQANAGVVAGWRWLSAKQGRTCIACLMADGTVHGLAERLTDHPNGRCTMVPITRTWAELGIAGMAETQPGPGQTGEAYFRGLPAATQQQMLGRSAWAAWQGGAVELRDFVGIRASALWGPTHYVRSLREILGEAEAAKWIRSGTRKTARSEALLLEADRVAAKHGVLVSHGDIMGVAEIVSQSLARFGHDEWLPREIRADAKHFLPAERQAVVGRYAYKGRVFFINPEHAYWQGGSAGAAEFIANLQAGYLSTADALHPLWHELGHAAHHRVLRHQYERLNYTAIWTNAEQDIAAIVSQRAAHSPTEFMAEVFALLMVGGSPDTAPRLLYTRFGGLIP
jgi:SPP1 gp7 family putative phage head morphogenesis protein